MKVTLRFDEVYRTLGSVSVTCFNFDETDHIVAKFVPKRDGIEQKSSFWALHII